MDRDLDEDFNCTLQRVQEQIKRLHCTKKTQLCNAWILRLKNVNADEKNVRNSYLHLMLSQLEKGRLHPPFLECPNCFGRLKPLDSNESSCSGSLASSGGRRCHNTCPANSCTKKTCPVMLERAHSVPEICTPDPVSGRRPVPDIQIDLIDSAASYGSTVNIRSPPETTPGSCQRLDPKKLATPIFSSHFKDRSDMGHFYSLMGGSAPRPAQPVPAYAPYSPTDPQTYSAVKKKLDLDDCKLDSQYNSQYLLINDGITYSESPDGSARTDSFGPPSFGPPSFEPCHIDAAFKRRLAEMNVIYQLRMDNLNDKVNCISKQNNSLRCQLSQASKTITEKSRMADQTIRQLQDENQHLQCKLQEVHGDGTEIRNVGQSIEQLSQQLKESVCVNEQLQQSINVLEQRICEAERSKTEEVCRQEQQQAQEIQHIRDCHRHKLLALAQDYNCKLQDMDESYKEQIRHLGEQHECSMQQLSEENNAAFQEFRVAADQAICEKEDEISRLQCLLNEQCEKLQSEVQGMQSSVGQEKCQKPECVSARESLCVCEKRLHKLQNIKNRCLKYFEGKLLDMLKEKHRHENTVRMMLMKQRAEITLQVFNESQLELKDAVSRLQERYKKIIQNMQNQISSSNTEVHMEACPERHQEDHCDTI